jgi:DNA-binding transcriptional LysR family regulator
VDRYGELLTFVRVAEAANFSSAARRLGLTASAVSKLITRLERRMGVRLFDRTSRATRLTREGRDLFASALHVVEAMNRTDNAVRGLRDAPKGTLRIFGPPVFTQYALGPLLPEFARRYPDIDIEILLRNEIIEPVRADVDVAIIRGRFASGNSIARKIFSSKMIVCAAPAYLREHGEPVEPDDLASHRCVTFAMNPAWNSWPFREHGKLLRMRIRGSIACDQGEMLRALALGGAGIVRLSEYHIAADIASGALVPLLADYEWREEEPFYAVYHSRGGLSPRIRVFLDYLTDNLQRLARPRT